MEQTNEEFLEEEDAPCHFVVTDEQAGARLDAFLAAQLADVSRARVKRAIEAGDTLVDGRMAKPSEKLRAGQRIEIEIAPAASLAELALEDVPLDIVFEDEQIAVINKPAGMIVHPGAGVARGTLANALAFHFQKLSARGGALRPGIVHRLDKDTSGLIVVAKTEAAHENLAEQFRRREVFKLYLALVHGVVRGDVGRIEESIGRDTARRTRMAILPIGRGGREALTIYRVRQRFERFTLLDVEIKTGRTHQIRVHLAHIKHPVVGDETYGGGRDKTISDTTLRARVSALKRQFLHAARLKFHHPQTGAPMRFDAPPPVELREFLEAVS